MDDREKKIRAARKISLDLEALPLPAIKHIGKSVKMLRSYHEGQTDARASIRRRERIAK